MIAKGVWNVKFFLIKNALSQTRLVANIMGSKILQRSFAYIKNNKGPSIDPWETPQVMFAKFVLLLSKDRNCL